MFLSFHFISFLHLFPPYVLVCTSCVWWGSCKPSWFFFFQHGGKSAKDVDGVAKEPEVIFSTSLLCISTDWMNTWRRTEVHQHRTELIYGPETFTEGAGGVWQAAAARSVLLLFVGSGRRRRHLPSGSAPFMASHLLRLQTALTRLAASRVSGAGALLAPPLSPRRMPIGLVAILTQACTCLQCRLEISGILAATEGKFYVWKFFMYT